MCKLLISFIFAALTVIVQCCDSDSPAYIRNNVYWDNTPACSPGNNGDNYFFTESYVNAFRSRVENFSSIRCNQISGCFALIITFLYGDINSDNGNAWQVDYYRSSAPPQEPSTTSCASPRSVYMIEKETLDSCFALSTSAASAYCSDLLQQNTPTAVTVPLTVTTPYSTTSTSTTTYLEQTTLISIAVKTVTTTSSSLATKTVTTTPTASITVVVTQTRTQSVCRVVPRALAEARQIDQRGVDRQQPAWQMFVRDVPTPACLSAGGASTPVDLISSACSCLYPKTVSSGTGTAATSEYDATASTTTTTTVLETTTTSTTATANLKITSVTTKTTIATRTIKTTSTAIIQVQKQKSQTFAMYVRLAAKLDTKYRLTARFQNDNVPSKPEDRIFQYSKPPAPQPAPGTPYSGVNGTIIDGQLYILTKPYNAPKLYGVGLLADGRMLLGQQANGVNAPLKGCSVNKSKGGLITCNLPSGQPARFQELNWDTTAPNGEFKIATIPTGANVKQYQPVVELIAADFGSVQLRCQS